MKPEWTEYKNKINAELALVESELKSVGQRKPGNPKDWEATPGNLDVSTADVNSAADRIEEYEDNTAILKQLEIRYNELKDALKKMEDGTYGICEVSGEEIEADRLEANPASKTCKAHM
ncbi:MAG: TraR/DksA C4-type zinc finger protein [Patescibacteria group bacterium]